MMIENGIVLRLVKVLALYYPILVDCSLPFTRLLTIVVPKGGIQLAKVALHNFLCRNLSPESSKAAIKAVLSSTHSGPILVSSCNSKRESKTMDYLAALFQTGYVDQQPIQALPVILTDELTILDEDQQRFFLFLQEPFHGDGAIPLEELLVSGEDVSCIIQHFSSLDADMDTEQRALTAASWFLAAAYPTQAEEIAALIEYICEAEELYRETSGVGRGFTQVLNDWLRGSEFTAVYEADGIIENLDEVKEHGMLYSAEYIYMPEKLFCSIVQPMIQGGIPILALKNALREEKLLLSGQSKNSFTTKISVLNAEGQRVRIRMMRLDRNKLREPGERDLIASCRARARRKQSSNT